MADDITLSEDDLRRLLEEAEGSAPEEAPAPPADEAPFAEALRAAEAAAAEGAGAAGAPETAADRGAEAAQVAPSSPRPSPARVQPVAFAPLAPSPAAPERQGLDLGILMDVPLRITVELGRTDMCVRQLLELGPGSVVELDRSAGEVLDVLVNGVPIAQGEVVVVDEQFGVRITQVFDTPSRDLLGAMARR